MLRKPVIKIREVFAENLDYEFKLISDNVDRYPFISMDTEFPGVIFKPLKLNSTRHLQTQRPSSSENYLALKSNVDMLKLIQVGITLTNSAGELPDLGSEGERFIWEFNFSDFDVTRDFHAPDSIDLLRENGIDFSKNRVYGIDSTRFAELMMGSGLVCSDAVTWVTFHSAYDFGYLVKILTQRVLPCDLKDFLELLKVFFGNNVYDLKYLIGFCNGLYGGLDQVSRSLKVDRVTGKCHQAGSDSLLTWQTFQKIRDVYFLNQSHEKYAGVLYGLEVY